MGVDYYECEICRRCVYAENIDYISVEGYEELTLCKWCREEYMDMSPKLVYIDLDDLTFWAKETEGSVSPTIFTSFYKLKVHIIGEPEDGIDETHLDWVSFGCSNYDFTYRLNGDPEKAEKDLYELEEKCQRKVWESTESRNEYNTIFHPKKRWLEDELDSVKHQMEDLKRKKIKLEELLK